MATVFDYTGGVQTFTAPESGLYKLDVWGAQGGQASSYEGAKGGHSVGYVVLNKDDVLYIACGGKGGTASASPNGTCAGGYNGGGSGKTSSNASYRGSGGGGATHIAKTTGVLSSVASANLLIVGAGGGGAMASGQNGGNGGGLNGQKDSYVYAGGYGTQTAGGSGQLRGSAGSYGKGGNYNGDNEGSGGGAGYYGGGSGRSGGGGAAYLGGVPEITYKGYNYMPMTEAGVWSGNGRAEIELIAKAFPTVKLGALTVDDAKLGERQIEAIYLGSQPLE